MQRNFKRQISSLEEIFRFISENTSMLTIDESVIFSIQLAIEELFTNMVKYNHTADSDIAIAIEIGENKIQINLTDYNSTEFDITKTQEVDISQSLAERKVGGLGLHLVKKMVDELSYHYSNGVSEVIFTKYLENQNV